MKNTKIVSTIGPATDTKDKLVNLIEEGVDVARLNFSHVDHETHGRIFDHIREVSEKTAIMADTKGPEIRTGLVKENTVLDEDHKVDIRSGDEETDKNTIYVSYDNFLDHIEVGDTVSIDDGLIELQVVDLEEEKAVCEVIHGGKLSDRKSVNVPGKDIGLFAPTQKDKEDIKFAAQKGFDFISVSFVKQAEDVRKVREILEDNDSNAKIISKIEHAKAVENFEEILEESDAIMVARGDLGVEMPASELPLLQKEMIEKCNKAGKPVITATQMLESMTENPTATRAEISDVANAVLDGTDAVMLSGETAVGEYPVRTVEFMRRIIEDVEASMTGQVHHTVKERAETTSQIISKNVWQTAREEDVRHIVVHTTSGGTARNIAKYRPEKPVIAFTDSESVERQLKLVWGVHPYYEEFPETVEEMINLSAQRLLKLGLVEKTDKIVLSAGMPTAVSGTTNMMQLREISEIVD